MKRQRFSQGKQKWLLQEKRNGFWYTLKESDTKFEGINVTTKPQFRG